MNQEDGGRQNEHAPFRQQAARRSEADEILAAVESLPPDRQGALTRVLVGEYHAGPLPSPNTLAGYEVVAPGSGQKIIDMAERQQRHDIEFANAVLKSESQYRVFTLAGALVVLLAVIGGSVACALAHESAAALTLGSVAGLSVLAGVLVKGRDLILDRRDLAAPSSPIPQRSAPHPPSKRPKSRQARS